MSARYYLYGRHDAAIWKLVHDRRFKSLIAQLYSERWVKPRDPDELDAAEHGARLGLLLEQDGLFAARNLVAIPRWALLEASERMAPAMHVYGEIARSAAAELQKAYDHTGCRQNFSWAEAGHAVVAGMLLDLTVGSHLHQSGVVEHAYDETVIWAFEKSVGFNYFGVQWVAAAKEAAGLAQLWHGTVERAALKVSPSAVSALVELVTNGKAPEPSERLLLKYLGLLTTSDQGDQSRIPFFSAGEMSENLLPLLWRQAERLVEEAIQPALAAGGSGRFWDDYPDQASSNHALVRVALELGADAAVASGAVATFPVGQAPSSWGRWLWCEQPGPFTLVDGSFAGKLEKERREP